MEISEALPEYKRYTYADYCSWEDDIRRELIDGVPYAMSAPSRSHQRIIVQLSILLGVFLKDKPCEVIVAPFDVRLNADTRDDTVVQPDVLVVCDESKLDEKGCIGAPDLAIEILSPSTAMRDKVLKYRWYLRSGVREYWIVSPDDKTVMVCILKNGEYVTTTYGGDEAVPVHVLEGCVIDLSEVFT